MRPDLEKLRGTPGFGRALSALVDSGRCLSADQAEKFLVGWFHLTLHPKPVTGADLDKLVKYVSSTRSGASHKGRQRRPDFVPSTLEELTGDATMATTKKTASKKTASKKTTSKKAGSFGETVDETTTASGTKKAAKPKAEKPAGGKKRGVGALAIELLLAGKTGEQVIAAVQKEFPESAISPSHINWYKNKIKRDGLA